MTDLPNRDELIELLKSLGNENDAEALEAARRVHARITAAGIDWDDLLVPEGAAADDPESGDDQDPDDEPRETPAERDKANAESLALIDKLLARSDISDDTREELEGYKTDIDEGEFAEGDRRYLRALIKRLPKR